MAIAWQQPEALLSSLLPRKPVQLQPQQHPHRVELEDALISECRHQQHSGATKHKLTSTALLCPCCPVQHSSMCTSKRTAACKHAIMGGDVAPLATVLARQHTTSNILHSGWCGCGETAKTNLVKTTEAGGRTAAPAASQPAMLACTAACGCGGMR